MRSARVLLLVTALAAVAVGCGDDDGDGDATGSDGQTTTVPGPGPAADAGGEELLGTPGAELEGKLTLSGSAEVPPTPLGEVVASVRVEALRLCVTVPLDDLESPFVGAHIHSGAADSNGPVAVDLTPTHDVDAGELDGCVELEADIGSSLVADPAGFYLNVHSQAHPDGAVRGQLNALTAA